MNSTSIAMKMVFIFILIAMAPAYCGETPVALVTEKNGTVQATINTSSWSPEIGETLPSGIKISVSAGGSLSFIHLSRNEEYKVDGKKEITISDENVEGVQPTTTTLSQVPQNLDLTAISSFQAGAGESNQGAKTIKEEVSQNSIAPEESAGPINKSASSAPGKISMEKTMSETNNLSSASDEDGGNANLSGQRSDNDGNAKNLVKEQIFAFPNDMTVDGKLVFVLPPDPLKTELRQPNNPNIPNWVSFKIYCPVESGNLQGGFEIQVGKTTPKSYKVNYSSAEYSKNLIIQALELEKNDCLEQAAEIWITSKNVKPEIAQAHLARILNKINSKISGIK